MDEETKQHNKELYEQMNPDLNIPLNGISFKETDSKSVKQDLTHTYNTKLFNKGSKFKKKAVETKDDMVKVKDSVEKKRKTGKYWVYLTTFSNTGEVELVPTYYTNIEDVPKKALTVEGYRISKKNKGKEFILLDIKEGKDFHNYSIKDMSATLYFNHFESNTTEKFVNSMNKVSNPIDTKILMYGGIAVVVGIVVYAMLYGG